MSDRGGSYLHTQPSFIKSGLDWLLEKLDIFLAVQCFLCEMLKEAAYHTPIAICYKKQKIMFIFLKQGWEPFFIEGANED